MIFPEQPPSQGLNSFEEQARVRRAAWGEVSDARRPPVTFLQLLSCLQPIDLLTSGFGPLVTESRLQKLTFDFPDPLVASVFFLNQLQQIKRGVVHHDHFDPFRFPPPA